MAENPLTSLGIGTGKINTRLTLSRATMLVIALGFMVRVVQYFFNRSLQVDEAMLALNIVQRDFTGLLQPLAMNQVTPVLFLWLEKAAVTVFGNSELSLRLVPFIASVISLLLIGRVAYRFTNDHLAVFFTTVFFAFSKTIIFYSSETKQ